MWYGNFRNVRFMYMFLSSLIFIGARASPHMVLLDLDYYSGNFIIQELASLGHPIYFYACCGSHL